MTKHVSISANENPLYLFYLPITCFAWNKFGWKPFVILVKEEHPSVNEPIFNFVTKSIPCERSSFWINAEADVRAGYKTETIAQLSRLYAAMYIPDGDYLLTGDADMIPLSDYWKNIFTEFPSLYGWDLTNYQHMPICYIGMSKKLWLKTMWISEYAITHGFSILSEDLRKLENAKNEDKIKRWVVDQDFITERINEIWPLDKFKHLTDNPRGIYPNGYPIGRVDRSAWSQLHEQYIDCHAPHDILTSHQSRRKLLHLLRFIWPNEDFTWWEVYEQQFLELLKTLP